MLKNTKPCDQIFSLRKPGVQMGVFCLLKAVCFGPTGCYASFIVWSVEIESTAVKYSAIFYHNELYIPVSKTISN